MKKVLLLVLALSSISSFAADNYKVQSALQSIQIARAQLEKAEYELQNALDAETKVYTCSIVMAVGMVKGTGNSIQAAKMDTLSNCINGGYMSNICESRVKTANCF